MKQTLIKNIVLILLKQGLKKPIYILIFLVLFGIWFFFENRIAPPVITSIGLPKIESGIVSKGESIILQNEGYVLAYSEKLANPLWVTYQVKSQSFKVGKRPRYFSTDNRTLAKISHRDYSHSGYSRGHMAPNYLIATRYGREAQQETFLMTNVSPQKGRLNQKTWQRLEEVITNDFSKWHGDFWVVTGPVFDDNPQRIKKTNIAIPKAFYKILIKPTTSQQPSIALAFIFPQNADPKASLMKFITSIDQVEEQTGIDFFSVLEDSEEDALEASITPKLWRLPEVANRPSRY